MSPVYESRERVAVIRIENPPVNALTTGVPEQIARAVENANRDADIDAIVIMGSGRTFAAGADIHEFVRFAAGEQALPELHRWFNSIEESAKPVIMAIHGQAFGAGLELAMAGHYRVAVADARIGQPEVNIGLIPGAGGTVRLPRLAGIEKAAEMIAFGEPISAQDALAAGIIDRIVEDDLLTGAIAFAREIRVSLRTRDLSVRGDVNVLAALRDRAAKSRKGLEAPLDALEVLAQTAMLPFEDGCAAEAEIFIRCLRSEQSHALIHVFFAERAISKVPGVDKDTQALPVREAGVIGAGTMGCGIAMAFANAGIRVRLKDVDQAALVRGLTTIRNNYDRSVASGRLSRKQRDERFTFIEPQLSYEGFENAEIIIEAVYESLDLKRQVFAEMDRVANAQCLLASNTSTLSIDVLAQATSRPSMVLGAHFFSPANVMRLLEIVRGRETSSAAIATAMALAKTLKKVGVVVGNGFGFVGNRLFIPYLNQAERLVEEGATPEQVDRVLTDFGMAMGPFAVMDLSGIDVFWRIRKETGREEATLGLPLLYEFGRFGQKTGAGWFKYGDDRKPIPDLEIVERIHRRAQEVGTKQRVIADEEILDRCMFALANEGSKVLEEGIAARSGDIDVMYVTGYGFPAYRGGPMFFAKRSGLFARMGLQ